MALLGGNKQELETKVIRLETQIDSLIGENQFLRKQVEKLQEALMSKEAPHAYRQMKMDEAVVEAEANGNFDMKDVIKQLDEDNKFASDYASAVEEPFFKDPADLIAKMSRMIGVNLPDSSHNNDES
jgi:regulator of replication initiation timing